MALSTLTGTATTTVKVGEFNSLIAALNAELTALAERLAILESEPDPVIPPDLTTRVEALESLIQRVPAENPNPVLLADSPGRPADLPADEVVLVYDRATLYYHDMELYAVRIGERTWRLLAQLNFVVISPVTWTYDEVVEGTPEEVYEHAQRRLLELAELKPQHDHVHERVRAMSEGRD
ncbi:MAG TPA: hypothetical protein VEG38_03685 [Acidimicrobiia bacterium]|nr:hypothetical protein [Acidimicrobiia bacterium]